MLLEGMHLPLTTPFTPDGRLNLRKLEDNVRRYSKTPAAGLVVLGRSGQPTLLSDVETREALRLVAETAAAEKVLIAGVARDSVIGTLDLIEYAAEVGFDVALVPVPSILRGRSGLPAKEALSFFRALADKSVLPVVLDCGDGEIAVEAVVELARHASVIGMVDASGDATRIAQVVKATADVRRDVTVTAVFAAATGRMLRKSGLGTTMMVSAGTLSGGGSALSVAPVNLLKTRTKAVGFQVLCGSTGSIIEALQAGAAGAVPPLAASAPQACYEVLAAWKDGDPALAEEKQDRLRTMAVRVEKELGVAGIKYGCDLNGYFGGRPRLPGLPLTGAEREEIEGLMAGIRN